MQVLDQKAVSASAQEGQYAGRCMVFLLRVISMYMCKCTLYAYMYVYIYIYMSIYAYVHVHIYQAHCKGCEATCVSGLCHPASAGLLTCLQQLAGGLV